MKFGTKVIVTKVGAIEGAAYRTASKAEYEPGQDNGPVSPPVEYEAKGYLAADLALGRGLYLQRTHRNGIEEPGGMVTSVITCITFQENGVLVTTRNSQYLVVEDRGEA